MHTTYRCSYQDGKGEPTAHVEILRRNGVLWLTNVWTAPEHRQKGCAVTLMEAAISEWAGEPIYLSVDPYVDEPLDAARLTGFYASYGFRPTDVPGIMRRDARPWYGRTGAA